MKCCSDDREKKENRENRYGRHRSGIINQCCDLRFFAIWDFRHGALEPAAADVILGKAKRDW
jgi:hypothetical protein